MAYTLILALFLFVGCNSGNTPFSDTSFDLEWTPIDSLNNNLPEGIRVYHSIHTGANLRAWYIFVKESHPDIETRVVVSTDADGRESVSDFANRLAAPVVINGGYFRMDLNPAKHVGILKADGQLLHSATSSVLRGEQRFFLYRSAIGFGMDNQVAVRWVSTQGDSVFSWSKPIDNMMGVPGEPADTSHREYWNVRDVLGGGPQLIKSGEIFISENEEVFFGTSIPEVHPRTAAGITNTGDLILLLVDGRQLISRGVDLKELAQILFNLGCVEAINLDGGGSSTLVVNGTLLNRPAGTTTQREVMSAIAVFDKKKVNSQSTF